MGLFLVGALSGLSMLFYRSSNLSLYLASKVAEVSELRFEGCSCYFLKDFMKYYEIKIINACSDWFPAMFASGYVNTASTIFVVYFIKEI